MEDLNAKMPLFKKIDRNIFERLDKFKQTSNYNNLQDFYNSMEEEQQKLFKFLVIILIFLLPSMFLGFIWWQNNTLKEDLNLRISLISKANEIIGQNQGLREVSPRILSSNPIDSEGMMTSRLSNILSTMNIDLAKIQVSGFASESISTQVMKAEADFAFNNFSTDELMNALTSMIQTEKFRIQAIDIKRNAETNLLQGKFHAIHYSSVSPTQEEE